MLAGYYCFVAAAIGRTSAERQHANLRFGQTAPCKDAGRTG